MIRPTAKNSTRIRLTLTYLGSVRFATPILAATAVALMYGTFVESSSGPSAARSAVYGAWWFLALMVGVCISLALSVVMRYPWRREHIGFIVVHGSLVVIIVSGFISYSMRIEDSMTLSSGMQAQTPAGLGSPFRIELVEYRSKNYPGTTMPMAHEADVIVSDASGRLVMETISINNPLRFKGSRVYLTGFLNHETAVLRITSDPGLLPMYAGCMSLCLGILIMNYSRRYSEITVPGTEHRSDSEDPLCVG